MEMNMIGLLLLRIGFAWIFLYPLPGLLKNWQITVDTTKLLFAWKPSFFAVISCLVMFVGALGVLLGIFPRICALTLFFFNIGGAQIHFSLGKLAQTLAAKDNQASSKQIADLAVVGHVTSAQKNYVIAAVSLFFVFSGTGPWSLYPVF